MVGHNTLTHEEMKGRTLLLLIAPEQRQGHTKGCRERVTANWRCRGSLCMANGMERLGFQGSL